MRTAALLLLGLGVFAPGVAAQAPPAKVRIGRVTQSKVLQHRLVVGQVEPARRVTVASEESGRVTQQPPEPGTAVEAGHVLAWTDTTLLKLEIESAEAAIALAVAQKAERAALLKVADRQWMRLAALVREKAARQKELDDAADEKAAAQSRLAVAEAMLLQAQTELKSLKARLEKSKIKAPFGGFIVRKLTERGAWLDTGDPVVELISMDKVKVVLSVPQALVPHVRMDRPVDIHVVPLGIRLSQKPLHLVPDGDTQARSFRLLVRLANADGRLKPGMSVSAYLPTGGEEEALTVPRDAVQTRPTGSVVYVVRSR